MVHCAYTIHAVGVHFHVLILYVSTFLNKKACLLLSVTLQPFFLFLDGQ